MNGDITVTSDRLPSAPNHLLDTAILGTLLTLEDRRWNEWRNGRALTTSSTAKLLKPFDVRTRKHRYGAGTQNGYQRGKVDEAFRRFCVD
jgi:hypothetical protein